MQALLDRYNAAGIFPAASPSAAGDGWYALPDLTGASLADRMRMFVELSGCPPETAAAHLAGWTTGSFSRLLVWAYRTERRVPLLTAAGTALHGNPGGWFDGVAVDRPQLAVLPGDPLVGEPGVHPVDNLAEALTSTVRTLAEPVVDTIKEQSRLGRRTIWALVADTVLGAFHADEPPGPSTARAAAEAEELLAGAGPLAVRRRWAGPVPIAAACCLAYKRPGLEYCERICPKLDEQTRAQQITEWLATAA
ncbi:hypothetical protein [Phytohabitans rumicis]|uniref:Ferric siderophore reductase C-terminal domain-containing protein n=1 Tax=Phytohabitans rumicis TaxID=1076125 RepID=A0A6V8L2D9_9ACTN|nr:hypothetical protein [Phytohabitans rumicis]GFJ91463.1 hypothetical protein Prum_051050 [Phytohabitans rumicis]